MLNINQMVLEESDDEPKYEFCSRCFLTLPLSGKCGICE